MFCLKTSQYVILIVSNVAIIAAYTYHPTDDAIQYESPSINITGKVETEGVTMIYPTKKGGDEWFMGPNLQNDTRFDANDNLSKNEEGSWSVNSTGQTTLNIWTRGSGDFRHMDGMDTYNHSII